MQGSGGAGVSVVTPLRVPERYQLNNLPSTSSNSLMGLACVWFSIGAPVPPCALGVVQALWLVVLVPWGRAPLHTKSAPPGAVELRLLVPHRTAVDLAVGSYKRNLLAPVRPFPRRSRQLPLCSRAHCAHCECSGCRGRPGLCRLTSQLVNVLHGSGCLRPL